MKPWRKGGQQFFYHIWAKRNRCNWYLGGDCHFKGANFTTRASTHNIGFFFHIPKRCMDKSVTPAPRRQYLPGQPDGVHPFAQRGLQLEHYFPKYHRLLSTDKGAAKKLFGVLLGLLACFRCAWQNLRVRHWRQDRAPL